MKVSPFRLSYWNLLRSAPKLHWKCRGTRKSTWFDATKFRQLITMEAELDERLDPP
jgi:hypothetical protein